MSHQINRHKICSYFFNGFLCNIPICRQDLSVWKKKQKLMSIEFYFWRVFKVKRSVSWKKHWKNQHLRKTQMMCAKWALRTTLLCIEFRGHSERSEEDKKPNNKCKPVNIYAIICLSAKVIQTTTTTTKSKRKAKKKKKNVSSSTSSCLMQASLATRCLPWSQIHLKFEMYAIIMRLCV